MLINDGPRSQGTCVRGQYVCAPERGAQVHAGATGVMGRPVVRGPWGEVTPVCGPNVTHFPGSFCSGPWS